MLPKFKSFKLEGGLAGYTALIAKEFPCAHNCFRGVTNSGYDLIPSLGRLACYKESDQQGKIELESHFLSKSFRAQVPLGPAHYNEIAAAIAAQHHGAPTRLLDWSDSPLISLFFATEPKVNSNGELVQPSADAAVWVKHECPVEHGPDGYPNNRSFEFNAAIAQRFREIQWACGSSGFQPLVLTPRLSAQLGSFTVCEKPDVDLRYQCSYSITNIWKILIPMEEIPTIQQDLYRLGVRKRSIYPDEDGLNTGLVVEMFLDEQLADRCSTD